MKSRILIIVFVFLVAGAGILARAFFVQVIPDQKLSQLRHAQFETVVTLEARRGIILDRQGKELAVSVAAFSVYADPGRIQKPKQVARKLSSILKLNPVTLLSKLKDHQKRFAWLARRQDQEVRNRIKELKMPGIGIVEEPRRIYPNNFLSGSVLGFTGSDSQGLHGIEARYDNYLKGTELAFNLQKDARGRPLILDGQVFNEKPDGANIAMTIDRDLQYVLEQELLDAVHTFDAVSGMGVILDPNDSSVLAMATVPGFNPNAPLVVNEDLRRNRVVTDPFEQGSVMKAFSLATGMKLGKLAPNKKYFCENGAYKVGKHTIKEADQKHKFGWLTATEILTHSSNIGTSKIAFEIGEKDFREGLKAFGFGEKTGIDLPGESRGIIPALPWSELNLATASFGYGIAVTPLQVANAYAAIANGGLLNTPYLVREVKNANGEILFEREKKKAIRVLDPHTASLLTLMLSNVTREDGTGFLAQVAGFPVAGKTGTAHKTQRGKIGYSANSYLSSFVGFIPAVNPKYVIYIAVDEPKRRYYGSEVAAPVFSKVAGYAMRKSNRSAVLVSEANKYRTPQQKIVARPVVEITRMPDWKGLTLREVLERVQNQSFEIQMTERAAFRNPFQNRVPL